MNLRLLNKVSSVSILDPIQLHLNLYPSAFQANENAHTAIRIYIKTLAIDLAFVLAHIGKLNKGIEEFDDQLNIKLKALKDKVDKKALKKKMK